MGMDVFGQAPTAPSGEYFRNNLWWWNPLWTYVVTHHSHLLPDDPDLGFYNDGYQLTKTQAFQLGAALLSEIKSGAIAQYQQDFNESKAAGGLRPCEYCHETGIRDDDIGRRHGLHEKELGSVEQILYGRTYGTCNVCQGSGQREPLDNYYYFTVDNVREFANFLINSGGIAIL